MKKNFASMMLTLALATAATQTTQAQEQQNPQPTEEQRMEQRSQRVAHKMGLSDEQTKKFSGIYADYQKELKGVMEKYPMHPAGKKDMKDKKDRKDDKAQMPEARKGNKRPQGWQPKEMTDQELEQMHKNHFARSRAMLDVEEKYYKKLRSVLTERQYEQLKSMQRKGWNKNRHHKAMHGKAKLGKNKRFQGKNMHFQGQQKPFAGKEMKAERQ
jgi:hypothetical protein